MLKVELIFGRDFFRLVKDRVDILQDKINQIKAQCREVQMKKVLLKTLMNIVGRVKSRFATFGNCAKNNYI